MSDSFEVKLLKMQKNLTVTTGWVM